MERLKTVVYKIDSLNEWIGSNVIYAFLAIVAVLTYEIISRYVFNKPTIWANHLATMLYGASLMLVGGYCLLQNSHIRMDLFYRGWSERTKAIVDICAFPLLLLFCGILLWKSATYAWIATLQQETALQVWAYPTWPWKLTIPIAALLFILQGVAQFIRNLAFITRGKKI